MSGLGPWVLSSRPTAPPKPASTQAGGADRAPEVDTQSASPEESGRVVRAETDPEAFAATARAHGRALGLAALDQVVPISEHVDLDALIERAERATVDRQLRELLEDEPLESGEPHAVEQLLSTVLKAQPLRGRHWIEAWVLTDADIGAVVIICLSRLEGARRYPWVYELAATALGQNRVSLRHAAARALERWGGAEAIRILAEHKEQEAWLADYVQRVIRDLHRRATRELRAG